MYRKRSKGKIESDNNAQFQGIGKRDGEGNGVAKGAVSLLCKVLNIYKAS